MIVRPRLRTSRPRRLASAALAGLVLTTVNPMGTGVTEVSAAKARVSIANTSERGRHITVSLGKTWARKTAIVEAVVTTTRKGKRVVRTTRLGVKRTTSKGTATICPRAKVPARATVRVRVGTRIIASRRVTRTITMNRCKPPALPAEVVNTPVDPVVATPPSTTSPSTIPPSVTPTVTLSGLTSATDTGFSSADSITNHTTPTVAGTATPNSTVQLFIDSTASTSSCAVSQNGAFECPLTNMAEGTFSITAVATLASVHSATSNAVTVRIDRTGPTATLTPARSMIGDNASTTVSITTNEPVVLTPSELELVCSMQGGCATSGFTGSNASYSIVFTTINNQANGGALVIRTGDLIDLAGNSSTQQFAATITYDMFGPRWSGQVLASSIRIDFDEPVTGFDLSDLAVGTYVFTGNGWQFQGHLTNQLSNLRSTNQTNTSWLVDMSSNVIMNMYDPHTPFMRLELIGTIEDEYGNSSTQQDQIQFDISYW